METPTDHGQAGARPASPASSDRVPGEAPAAEAAAVATTRRQSVARLLFSNDPRQQYAALRQLVSASEVTDSHLERVEEIRRQTVHLLIAELAERVLEDKRQRRPAAISDRSRQEVAALLRAQDERDRQRQQRASREGRAVLGSGVALFPWLLCATLVGGAVGAMGTYWLTPRHEAHQATTAAVLIHPRSGELLCVEDTPAATASPDADRTGFEPAYYCWKCQKWLPVRNPRQPAQGIEGPRQALSARPMAAAAPPTAARPR